ncbi:hypothetical protein AXF42_Ash016271 [Apostasia shenzhenica]|uniref:PB1 domain-containing protein n=1 Tax=Apostasia shenzhenica TaxID=1088818 RepID=A0A2H9ZX89_9ASPA|nr:hypothetical protein AXF42_Ash016271 [Apostasia shenzhenica]
MTTEMHNEDSSSAAAGGHLVRLMCSFGGRILPRPHDHQFRYVGGDTRIVAVPRSVSFAALLSKFSKIAGATSSMDQLSVKYQLPNEDLDALISLTSDEDVENMMDEYDRLSVSSSGGAVSRNPRLRIFLFPPGGATVAHSGSFGSILDGSGSKRDEWFLDVLNGSSAAAAPASLQRGRSEASSIISEVPDYLFGFDNTSETPSMSAAPADRPTNRPVQENLCSSESSSPAPSGPAISDLQPVRTKPEADPTVEPPSYQQTGYMPNPVWPYMAEHVPVYYVPGSVVPGGSLPVQQLPIPYAYAHQVAGGQLPAGFGQPVYVGGRPVMSAAAYEYPVQPTPVAADAYEVVATGGLMRSPTVVPVFPASGVAPPGGEPPAPGVSDMRTGRAPQ